MAVLGLWVFAILWLACGVVTVWMMTYLEHVNEIALLEVCGVLLFGPCGLVMITATLFFDYAEKRIVWKRNNR